MKVNYTYKWEEFVLGAYVITAVVMGVLTITSLIMNSLTDVALNGAITAIAVIQIIKRKQFTLATQQKLALAGAAVLVVIVAFWNIGFEEMVKTGLMNAIMTGELFEVYVSFIMQTLIYLIFGLNIFIATTIYHITKAQKNHQSSLQLKKLAVTDIPSLEAEYQKVAQAKAPAMPPLNGEAHYYVAINSENQGLKTRAEIEAHKAEETLLIWSEGWTNWRTYDQVFGND